MPNTHKMISEALTEEASHILFTINYREEIDLK